MLPKTIYFQNVVVESGDVLDGFAELPEEWKSDQSGDLADHATCESKDTTEASEHIGQCEVEMGDGHHIEVVCYFEFIVEEVILLLSWILGAN